MGAQQLTTEQYINRLELLLKHERGQTTKIRNDFELLEREVKQMNQRMDEMHEKYLNVLNVVGHLAQRNDGVKV